MAYKGKLIITSDWFLANGYLRGNATAIRSASINRASGSLQLSMLTTVVQIPWADIEQAVPFELPESKFLTTVGMSAEQDQVWIEFESDQEAPPLALHTRGEEVYVIGTLDETGFQGPE